MKLQWTCDFSVDLPHLQRGLAEAACHPQCPFCSRVSIEYPEHESDGEHDDGGKDESDREQSALGSKRCVHRSGPIITCSRTPSSSTLLRTGTPTSTRRMPTGE